MPFTSVRICRKIGCATKNTVVYQHNRFVVVPRAGDHIRLDVFGKRVEVEAVEHTPPTEIDIFLKPDYRGYGKGSKVKSHEEIVKEYTNKGWQLL